mmetsp:Transcript_77582/g.222201  ORF Transcript_77582/g.222201 Transcript_77582/m.222201 type:complete len:360 (+) Transcript_77582:68-1147(+)
MHDTRGQCPQATPLCSLLQFVHTADEGRTDAQDQKRVQRPVGRVGSCDGATATTHRTRAREEVNAELQNRAEDPEVGEQLPQRAEKQLNPAVHQHETKQPHHHCQGSLEFPLRGHQALRRCLLLRHDQHVIRACCGHEGICHGKGIRETLQEVRDASLQALLGTVCIFEILVLFRLPQEGLMPLVSEVCVARIRPCQHRGVAVVLVVLQWHQRPRSRSHLCLLDLNAHYARWAAWYVLEPCQEVTQIRTDRGSTEAGSEEDRLLVVERGYLTLLISAERSNLLKVFEFALYITRLPSLQLPHHPLGHCEIAKGGCRKFQCDERRRCWRVLVPHGVREVVGILVFVHPLLAVCVRRGIVF